MKVLWEMWITNSSLQCISKYKISLENRESSDYIFQIMEITIGENIDIILNIYLLILA